MVEHQIKARGIADPAVLEAMRSVPREAFIPEDLRASAYEDEPLPIGDGQTISQPYIVAIMLEAANLSYGDRVLEVGAGSGYAAAVMAEIAGRVHTIERIGTLGRQLRERIARLGYDNIEVHIADGSKGLVEAAPFDAILVAAGAPAAPDALKQQLAIGGRLIIPVGSEGRAVQSLSRITRISHDRYETENLGAVRFVPLIGEEGWQDERAFLSNRHRPEAGEKKALSDLVADAAEPLPTPEDASFAGIIDRFADRRVILLGEASHGTAEFYRARAAITRQLIEKHGFTIVAAEADWPDAAAINRHVRHAAPRPHGEPPFQRFPTWMWANTEIDKLISWMRDENEGRSQEGMAGFYGLDMYNMRGSIAAVLDYLDEVDPQAAAIARERYGCLTPWQHDPVTYGRAALSKGYGECEVAVVRQLRELLERQTEYAQDGDEGFLDAAQSARLIAAAEKYYRIMYYGGAESWNLRDSHMFQTLDHLLDAKGPDAKAVVWAHNSHIGDARETEMGGVRGEHNLGQLCREAYGDDVALIGFGTNTGTVAAASDWGGAMEVKQVRPALAGSHERLCHETGHERFLLDLSSKAEGEVTAALQTPMLQRFIGVIYRPETERQSHYAEAALSKQFDAYFWFDETTALTPLGIADRDGGLPDTYPFAV